MRKVINKMVTEEDLIRTVTTAYGNGWRQVKLYFMCGLPTETDEDVLQIADLAHEGHRRPAARSPAHDDIRCTVSHRRVRAQAAHAVPVGRAARRRGRPTRGCGKLRDAIRADRQYGRAIGFRYHDGKPGIVEGLLSRGDRRVGAVIEQVWRGRRPLRRLERALLLRPLDARPPRRRWPAPASTSTGTPPASATYDEVLPWDHLDSGLDKDWLWEDWQDAARRGRGRGLPLDPVLRLRRLPADGHRDPDRPDRQEAAAAHRRQRGPRCRAAGTPRPAHREPESRMQA